MANWYTNVALKQTNAGVVVRTLSQLGRHAIVNPAQNGWLTVSMNTVTNSISTNSNRWH